MSAYPSNPFVLPGLGQSGEAASNPLLASMQMMREAFAGLTGPGGLTTGLQMTRAMDPEELEKKIADLRTVENWLKLNLSMLSSTIQGMEVQLATIVTLRSYVSSMGGAGEKTKAEGASPLEQVLGLHPAGNAASTEHQPEIEPQTKPETVSPWRAFQATGTAKPRTEQAAAVSDKPAAGDQSATPAEAFGAAAIKQAADAAPAAAQAWWNMLQQQFGQVAQATAASMASGATAAKSAGASVNEAQAVKSASQAPVQPVNKSARSRPVTANGKRVSKTAVKKSASVKKTVKTKPTQS